VEDVTNSVYVLGPSGQILDRYDKSRLVPGMEAGRYVPGETSGIATVGGWTVGTLLCYESLFSGMARQRRRGGAQLLLNLSSDVWFGDEDSFSGSLFLHQHPAHLILRAVENRMSVARAANGGFSFVLSPTGEAVSDPFLASGRADLIQTSAYPGTTLYSRLGDWVGPLALLLCLVLTFKARSPGSALNPPGGVGTDP
jgi:apolipoprotein N-acyltransferase